MLKEQAKILSRISMAVDLSVVLAAFGVAYLVRRNYLPELLPIREYVWALLIIVPLWVYLLARHKFFDSIRRLSPLDIVSRMLTVHCWGGFILASVIFFFDRAVFSRSLFILFLFFAFAFLTLEKIVLRLVLGSLRRRGYNYRQIVIVGTREKARRFNQLLHQHADWGIRVAGFVQASDPPLQHYVDGYEVLGHVSDLIEICKGRTVDEVVFCLPKDIALNAESYLRELEKLGITMRVVLDFYQMDDARKELEFFHEEIPILTFHNKTLDAQQLLAKRMLDIAGSLVGLGILAALCPFIALAIKLESVGPVFFTQKRVGESGRVFRCWKFRTMVVDAEAKKAQLSAYNEMNGAIFKIRNDPRVTRVGKFLRTTSLDELPQFWNVFKGEMSLVGTRPPTPDEVARYENWHRRRISIKPGITGMWQVSGRNRIDDFDEIVKLDLKYIDQWNLWLDLKILCKTLGVVMARRGSC